MPVGPVAIAAQNIKVPPRRINDSAERIGRFMFGPLLREEETK